MTTKMDTLDRMAAIIDLCRKLEVCPEMVETSGGDARIVFAHADLTGPQRRAIKRHFGTFTKSNFTGDIFSEPDPNKCRAVIRAAYECRTVCVAQRVGAEDYEMPAETVTA